MSTIEQTCGNCDTINLVSKSYNCTSCKVWNKFILEDEPVIKQSKKGKKNKWLN